MERVTLIAMYKIWVFWVINLKNPSQVINSKLDWMKPQCN